MERNQFWRAAAEGAGIGAVAVITAMVAIHGHWGVAVLLVAVLVSLALGLYWSRPR